MRADCSVHWFSQGCSHFYLRVKFSFQRVILFMLLILIIFCYYIVLFELKWPNYAFKGFIESYSQVLLLLVHVPLKAEITCMHILNLQSFSTWKTVKKNNYPVKCTLEWECPFCPWLTKARRKHCSWLWCKSISYFNRKMFSVWTSCINRKYINQGRKTVLDAKRFMHLPDDFIWSHLRWSIAFNVHIHVIHASHCKSWYDPCLEKKNYFHYFNSLK